MKMAGKRKAESGKRKAESRNAKKRRGTKVHRRGAKTQRKAPSERPVSAPPRLRGEPLTPGPQPPAPSFLTPAPIEFDLPAIAAKLDALCRRGNGVLKVVLPAEVVITLGLDAIKPEHYQALAQLGGEAFLEDQEREEDARLDRRRAAAKCRLRRQPGCDWVRDRDKYWQEHAVTPVGPGDGDLTEAALERADLYVDWLARKLVALARWQANGRAGVRVDPADVDAAARRLLDPCPVFDEQGDEVEQPRSRGSGIRG